MTEMIILGGFAAAIALYLWWGFRHLTKEQLQILAALPSEKGSADIWIGTNITWYGLLTANAYLVAVMVMLVLLGSIGITNMAMAMLAVALLAICVPASSIIAALVEKKAHTFTVGGAVFVGVLATPPLIILLNETAGHVYGFHLPVMATCAAIAISYAFGEGLGRLACISFGCCYGRPLSDAPSWLTKIVGNRGFTFRGCLKKASYAGDLEGVRLFPVQAVTATLYSCLALASTALFLEGMHAIAFIIASTGTQLWRTASETMRADFRGGGKVTVYQMMGIAGALYAIAAAIIIPQETSSLPLLMNGIQNLWNPMLILLLQGIWLYIFIHTGRSRVTGSKIRFHLNHESI